MLSQYAPGQKMVGFANRLWEGMSGFMARKNIPYVEQHDFVENYLM